MCVCMHDVWACAFHAVTVDAIVQPKGDSCLILLYGSHEKLKSSDMVVIAFIY